MGAAAAEVLIGRLRLRDLSSQRLRGALAGVSAPAEP